MKKQISYPKIKQFGDVVGSVVRQATFMGLDENEDAIYDGLQPKPTLTFKGTVKIHGTNAGISYNSEKGLWAQSRENIITPQKDNAGFAFFVESNNVLFEEMVKDIAMDNDIDLTENTVSIYGEWAGGNIQGNVAIKELAKALYIFGVKISPFDTEQVAYWVDSTSYDSESTISRHLRLR
jgi:DNA replication protein DnaD